MSCVCEYAAADFLRRINCAAAKWKQQQRNVASKVTKQCWTTHSSELLEADHLKKDTRKRIERITSVIMSSNYYHDTFKNTRRNMVNY